MCDFSQYVSILANCVPIGVYLFLIVFLCALGSVLLSKNWGGQGKLQFLWLLLIEYVLLIFCSTVLCRDYYPASAVHLRPFWSYYSQIDGQFGIQPEHIMNVIIFIPIGIIIGMMSMRNVIWKAAIIGCLASCTIELFQYLFSRGICEIDDVANNTIGCVIGGFIIKKLRLTSESVSNILASRRWQAAKPSGAGNSRIRSNCCKE